MTTELKFDLLSWQKKIFNDETRFQVVVAGRRCGKTRMSAVKTLVKAAECPSSDAGVLYVAPTQGMARTLMWDLLIGMAGPLIYNSNVNNGEIKLKNGVKIYIRGADNPDALRGMKLYYAVLDEFKDMKPSVYELIIRPALSDMKGGALFIGTPEPGESLFRQYFDLGMSGSDHEWKSWHLTTADNELIDPKEIEAARRSMSTFAFMQEYEASFECMGSNIFKEEWLLYSDEEPKEGDYYIAVDLAGFEDVSDPNKKKWLDDTAIAVVKITPDGKWWVKKIEHGRWDIRENALRILMAIRTYRPIMIGIESGALMKAIMPYLTDLMRKNNIYAHIEPISTAGSSKKGETLANRVIYNLQGMFEHGRITLNRRENWQKFKEQYLMFPSKKAHDDCFPAETPIITLDGIKPIVEVTTDDYVLTRYGFRRVLKAWCKGNKKVITKFGITATPEHRIYTENRGWVELDSLSIDDILVECQPIKDTSCEKQSNLMEENITDTQTQNRQTIKDITHHTISGNPHQDYCIETFGNSITEKYQKDTKSITKMEIATIMTYPILYAYQTQNIKWRIEKKEAKELEQKNILHISNQSDTLQKHGILQKKEENGIEIMQQDQLRRICQRSHVLSAENSSNQKCKKVQCVAQNVKESDQEIKTEHGMLVPVYDLMVENDHEFFAYGVLVHNCIDALSLIANLSVTTYRGGMDEYDDYEPLEIVTGI